VIKWLWRLIVGSGCWGAACKWEEVKHSRLVSDDGERKYIGDYYILRCTVCGTLKNFRT
jgi:hypothetical protein